jgi:hypothetical protein
MGTQQDLTRFWQGLHDRRINRPSTFAAAKWQQHGGDSAAAPRLPKNRLKTAKLAAKKTQPACRSAEQASKCWNYSGFRR